jgi:hypothetical protein
MPGISPEGEAGNDIYALSLVQFFFQPGAIINVLPVSVFELGEQFPGLRRIVAISLQLSKDSTLPGKNPLCFGDMTVRLR